MTLNTRCRNQGFTLMEMIIVIVVLAVASIGIASMHGNIFSGQDSVKDLQVRTRLMEECAEQVLAVRDHNTGGYGYDAVSTPTRFGTNLCDGVPALGSYSIPTVTSDTSALATCPTGTLCKTISISQGGMTPLVLLMVDY